MVVSQPLAELGQIEELGLVGENMSAFSGESALGTTIFKPVSYKSPSALARLGEHLLDRGVVALGP